MGDAIRDRIRFGFSGNWLSFPRTEPAQEPPSVCYAVSPGSNVQRFKPKAVRVMGRRLAGLSLVFDIISCFPGLGIFLVT